MAEKTLTAIINTGSGSVPDDAEAHLEALLSELGWSADIFTNDGENLVDAVKAAVAARDDGPILVWGGDGTVGCLLANLDNRSRPILPVPGGTMNMLHQSVHATSYEWDVAVTRALQQQHVRDLPGGTVDGCAIYVGVFLGPMTRLTRSREALRDGAVLKAMREALTGDPVDLSARLAAEFEDGEAMEGSALVAFITSGPDGPTYEVGAIDPDDMGDLAATAVGLMFSDWRDHPGVAYRHATSFSVRSEDGEAIDVTLDGELTTVPSGAVFTLDPQAATVLSAA